MNCFVTQIRKYLKSKNFLYKALLLIDMPSVTLSFVKNNVMLKFVFTSKHHFIFSTIRFRGNRYFKGLLCVKNFLKLMKNIEYDSEYIVT